MRIEKGASIVSIGIYYNTTNNLSVFGRLYIIVHSIYLLSCCYIGV